MSTYIAEAGDTFERIARLKYGDDRKASFIRHANPSIVNMSDVFGVYTIPEGALIQVPNLPPVITPNPPSSAVGKDTVTVRVAGKEFSNWSAAALTQNVGKFDTFTLRAPYEPDGSLFDGVIKPFSFAPCELFIGEQLMLVGTILNVKPIMSTSGRTINIDGYAKAGILNDCMVPVSVYPNLETDDVKLNTLVDSLIAPFGLTATYLADVGAPFLEVSLDASNKILSTISKLSKQRDLLLRNDNLGNLVFSKIDESDVSIRLDEFDDTVTDIEVDFSAQNFYSSVTGTQPMVLSLVGESHTIENPLLEDVFRPYVFETDDVAEEALPDLVRPKFNRMYSDSMKFTVKVRGWRDHTDQLWKVGSMVELIAPGVMVKKETKLMIRQVVFGVDNQGGNVATLTLTYPSVPESFPWDE